MRDNIKFFNECNMEVMKRYPDGYFNLAIVDPPYGININESMGRRKGDKHSGHKKAYWDNMIPSAEYFGELQRVSKNQIIWGGELHDRTLASFTLLATVGQRVFAECDICTV